MVQMLKEAIIGEKKKKKVQSLQTGGQMQGVSLCLPPLYLCHAQDCNRLADLADSFC